MFPWVQRCRHLGIYRTPSCTRLPLELPAQATPEAGGQSPAACGGSAHGHVAPPPPLYFLRRACISRFIPGGSVEVGTAMVDDVPGSSQRTSPEGLQGCTPPPAPSWRWWFVKAVSVHHQVSHHTGVYRPRRFLGHWLGLAVCRPWARAGQGGGYAPGL